MRKKINVLWCPAFGEPSIKQIENDLGFMQTMVGGYIECVPLRNGIDLICNEEGAIRCLPLNTNLYPELFGFSDMFICGNYFLCSHDSNGNFKSIPTDKLKQLLSLGKAASEMREEKR